MNDLVFAASCSFSKIGYARAALRHGRRAGMRSAAPQRRGDRERGHVMTDRLRSFGVWNGSASTPALGKAGSYKQRRGMRHVGTPAFVWLVAIFLGLPALQALAQEAPSPPPLKPEELDQLVAPIALYPDPLLAQVLMASTYPLEIVQAARWAKENPNLKGDALENALQQQPWDASVKSLTAFPQVLTMMNDKLDWTQKLGDAFLAQQEGVMDAVQQLRAKAQTEGNLKTTKEQKVIVEQQPAPVQQNVTVQQAPPTTQVIKIEPANPQVVYVPTYNPSTVYGPWPYPAYPPYYYYPPGYTFATAAISFGVGLAVGSALWGGCNWGGYGHNNVYINTNNYNNFNRTNISNKNWQHNVEHRKGVQYRDRGTQQRYGRGGQAGVDTRQAFRGRAEQGRQELARGGGAGFGGTGSRQGPRAGGSELGGGGTRGGQRGGGAAQRPAQAARPGGAGGARREARPAGAFQGMGNGNQVRQYSDRGRASRQSASAWSGRGGGGGMHGGGGRGGFGGGGARGGGGRRR
jgi:hypothetical protein